MTAAREEPLIVVCPDGPLLVRGHIELTSPDGHPVEQRRRTVALCRCGVSMIKPFCDGSHKAVHFKSDPDPVAGGEIEQGPASHGS